MHSLTSWKWTGALVIWGCLHINGMSADEIEKLAPEKHPAFVDKIAQKQTQALWRTRVGTSSSAPVVAGNKLLVGTNNARPRNPDRQGDLGVMMCFDAQTGEFLWQATHDKLPRRIQDTPGVGIQSQPVISGQRAYYFSNRGELMCLDMDGFYDDENDGPYTEESRTGRHDADICWSIDTIADLGVFKRALSDNVTPLGSPVLFGDNVFCNTSNGSTYGHERTTRVPSPDAPSVLAADAGTGKIKWTNAMPGDDIVLSQWASPVVKEIYGRNQVIFGAGDGRLYGIDPVDGTLLWKVELSDKVVYPFAGNRERDSKDFFVSRPYIDDDLIIFSLGRGTGELVRRKRNVFAIGTRAATTGREEIKWTFRDDDFGEGTLGEIVAKDELVFALSSSGFLICLDRESGRKHWSADLGNVSAVLGSPVIGENRVYAATPNEIFAFALNEEKSLLVHYSFDGTLLRTAVAEDSDRLYVVTSEYLWAIGK